MSPGGTANVTTSITPLAIRELSVADLRCHDHETWQCDPGLNLLIGPNGSGKTTLLEAVYLMAHGRSFRQARDPELVRRGASRFHLLGSWYRYGPMQIKVAGKRGNISLQLQGREIRRRKDVTESFPVLVESPQGRKIVDGVAGERRRWLDNLILTCYPNLSMHYERYLRSVMQRARLLRRHAGSDELEAWESQIVHHGMPIVNARQKLVAEMNELLVHEQRLTEQRLAMQLTGPDYVKSEWLQRLSRKRPEDLRSGGLRYGPHSDTVAIHFAGREIRSAGSRGQQKLAAIAIKMAECVLWERYRHLSPVLLLDDCFEALDPGRQERLLERLAESRGQILMTAPTEVAVPRDVKVARRTLDGKEPADSTAGGKMEEAA